MDYQKSKMISGIIVIIVVMIAIGIGVVLSQGSYYNEIKRIAQKAEKYDNYTVTIVRKIYEGDNENISETKITRKGNIRKEEYNQANGTKEVVWYTGEKVIAESVKKVKDSTTILNDLESLSQYIENKDKYEYLGEKEHNGRKCIVGQFLRKEGSSDKNSKTMVWIDKENEVILKEQHYDVNDKLQYEYLYNDLELNKVTDEQVKLPNLDGYTEFEN